MDKITLAISQPIPYSCSSLSNQLFNLTVNYLTTTPESAYRRGFNNFYLCSEYVHSSCWTVNNDFHRDFPCVPVLSKDWKNSNKLGDLQISTFRAIIIIIRIIASLGS